MAILKKTNTPAPQKTGTQSPKGGGSPGNGGEQKRDPFAKKLAETDAAEGGAWNPPPPGTYNALLTEAQGEMDGDKRSAYLEFTICEEDNEVVHGKTARIYFNFTDENGEEKTGFPYFKQAMTMFGVDTDTEIDSWDDMCAVLARLAEEEPWAVIDVKKKGKYTNIFLNSVPENQAE